jgi:hypothetical protein
MAISINRKLAAWGYQLEGLDLVGDECYLNALSDWHQEGM